MGALAMALRGAPIVFVLVNLGALVAALALAFVRWRHPATILVAAPLLVGLTLVVGTPLDGVRRWLDLGPVALHVGMTVLPAFVVVAARRADAASLAAVAIVAAALTAQPDRGTALALAAALFAGALLQRSAWAPASATCAALAVVLTFERTDPLMPVPHVEDVLQHLATWSGPLAAAAAAALLAAIAAPLRAGADGAALAGFYLGLAIASLTGPYPTPLLGYGVAPIIGYGIAIGAIEGGRTWNFRNRASPSR